jgi:hypothetical protein
LGAQLTAVEGRLYRFSHAGHSRFNRSDTGLNPQSLQVEFGWIELVRATSTRIFSHGTRI